MLFSMEVLLHRRIPRRMPVPDGLRRWLFCKLEQSGFGQLLVIKDGVEELLEQLDRAAEDRQAFRGDGDVVTVLAERLADVLTPAVSAPGEFGSSGIFITLTVLRYGLSVR